MCLAIAPVALCAQDHLAGAMLGEVSPEVHSEVNTSANTSFNPEVSPETNAAPVYTAAPTASISLPDAPAPQRVRVVDKKFIAMTAALAGSETLRLTTHKLVLDNEFAAGAPWVTSVPGNPHLVVKFSAIFVAEVLVAYELKKPHPWLPGDKVIQKLWWVYPATMIPIHLKNGVRSIRTQPPSCPVEECQEQ